MDVETADVASGRSQLRVFDVQSLVSGAKAVEYTDGDVMGWGLRNSVGIAHNPTTGDIWAVDKSLDDTHRFGVDIHNSNPGEGMNFYGRTNDTANYGRNFGYPGCLAVFDTTNVETYIHGLQKPMIGDQFVGDHQPQYSDLWCR
ncbi:Soluble quinoprotein glucose/sorbosone dehydrogenase [Cordyceps fumosorosea ARSEF 2679]|uniref:Soluble quinoprotein glucose/sorbosone dehydrogenase n=1 Tax=Cordyceps fumosorosea (strain ARSEF 2679) TaxID=1081104 RepID=A0A167UD13_CORFA|nr:Soluble quinoprotein glucose/sorbosone dehydrogenase [Cordyceps fumosorosea ARSEF 2679]OAA61463.1 Soluble quinoprotein glucose/sorbosone dehydrogenase [Cordyceps fumosorosea ARSEF 2679]